MWHAGPMSESSPADLAIAFRSFDRRRSEAIGDADPSTVADLTAEVDEHIRAAASVLGAAPNADAVSSELERRRPETWDDDTLAAVRAHATQAGSAIRAIGERVESSSGDDHDHKGSDDY
jgi:hypothetical protein